MNQRVHFEGGFWNLRFSLLWSSWTSGWQQETFFFGFSKNEATVYGKHGRRRGLAFSMVVVHTAMAMGSEFVWNSNTSLAVCWWVTSAGWRQIALAVCELPGFRLGRRLLLPVDPADSHSASFLHTASQAPKGPVARGQVERGREPLPSKQTCSLHIHFIKTYVFLEFLLASCCLFLVGLTVRTEVNWAVSHRNTG